MKTRRIEATVLGVLLLLAILCGVFSSVEAIEQPDYLTQLPHVETKVLVAIFFQAMMAIVYVAVLAITYRIVREDSSGGATAYLVLRSIGAGFLFAGIVTLSLFLTLGRHVESASEADLVVFQLIGELMRHARDGLNHVGMVLPWSLGSLLLYRSFWRTELVPRTLSAVGVVGAMLTLVATLLYMLDQVQLVTIWYIGLNVPTALVEVVLAIYLIVRGYRRAS